ncbi:MAG: response regulator transcription factor [Thermincola sp.]|jgi:two-component system response regulator ResD|nr:response regulator transcription factor [Thermincola sp.]MDT3703907.1 response regulator transcription factor [Thermincola sp.]
MNPSANILIADDEAKMRDLVKMYLVREGYKVSEAADGEQALSQLSKNTFDLVILDIMMPKIDGLTVCKEIRKNSDIPVIMLTARGEEIDRVLGFELGADDYVVKPFSPRELAARVKALLRRTAAKPSAATGAIMRFPGLEINNEAREVSVENNRVNLTPKEFELLTFLAKNIGRVFTREQLLEHVWGYDFYGDLRTVDTHVKKLREKISRHGEAAGYISTVWGVGYKFEVAK